MDKYITQVISTLVTIYQKYTNAQADSNLVNYASSSSKLSSQ
jgi:hypothetical protein